MHRSIATAMQRLFPAAIVALAAVASTSTARDPAEPGAGAFTRIDLSGCERYPATGMKVGEPGFDGTGRGFEAAAFTAALEPTRAGGECVVSGIPFACPTTDGLHVLAEGQTLPVEAEGLVYRVHFLGASGWGQASGHVEFLADAGVQRACLRLSEWLAAPTSGEAVAARVTRTTDDGTTVQRPACLFVQTVPLGEAVRLSAIRMPMVPDLHIFAITLDHRPSGTPEGKTIIPAATASAPVVNLSIRPPRKADGPPVGFVVHPHEPHFDEYTDSGAGTMLSNAFCWRVADPETCRIDLAFPARNLQYCYANDLTVAPIIDNSLMLAGSTWVGRYARLKGEGILSAENRSWTWPSPYSPIYRREMRRYAEQVTRWVNANDPDRRVTAYLNGAEWFWQGSFDYSRPTLTVFRSRMQERYRTINRLNKTWGTRYISFDDVEPPRLFASGATGGRPATFTVGPLWNDTSWSLPMEQAIACRPGESFEGEALVQLDGMLPIHVDLEGVWLNGEGRIIGWQPTRNDPGPQPGQHRIWWEDTAPPAAARLWLHLKAKGPGTAWFEHLAIRRTKPEKTTLLEDNFADAEPKGWRFSAYTGPGRGEFVAAEGGRPAALQTTIPQAELPYRNTTAAVVDYVEFTWEALADAIDDQAAAIKKLDPSRPVASYLGFAWALPVVWDNAITNHAIDVTCSRARSLDVVGLQLCSARGDFHYASSTLDIARKYGKPMWATDLIDFTHGTHVGFASLDQLTQACIQHGLDGVFWYCWYGTPDYNYHTGLPDEQVRSLVRNAEDSIRELQGFEPVVRVALVNPIVPYWLGDPDGMKNDAFDAYGWQKLLGEMGVAVDLWTPYELDRAPAEALDAYRVVVLPDSAFLPVRAIGKLDRLLARGGGLVCSGRLPRWDSRGRELGPDSLSLENRDVLRFEGKVGREYLGRMKRFREAGNTPPLFIEVEGRSEARGAGRSVQVRVRRFLEERGVAPLLPDNEHRVEACAYDREGQAMLFVLRGEAAPNPVRSVRVNVPAAQVSVKADHGPWQPVPVTGAEATLPDFQNVCLVRYAK